MKQAVSIAHASNCKQRLRNTWFSTCIQQPQGEQACWHVGIGTLYSTSGLSLLHLYDAAAFDVAKHALHSMSASNSCTVFSSEALLAGGVRDVGANACHTLHSTTLHLNALQSPLHAPHFHSLLRESAMHQKAPGFTTAIKQLHIPLFMLLPPPMYFQGTLLCIYINFSLHCTTHLHSSPGGPLQGLAFIPASHNPTSSRNKIQHLLSSWSVSVVLSSLCDFGTEEALLAVPRAHLVDLSA